MPVIHIKPQYGVQFGYNDTGGNYTSGGFNYGFRTDRVTMIRFNVIPVPKGSTINSATLNFAISVKNNTTQTVTFRPWLDGNIGPTCQWLDTTRNEWAGRTWGSPGNQYVFTWDAVLGATQNRQVFGLNIKSQLDVCVASNNWTLAGGSAAFIIGVDAVQNPDNIYIHTPGDNWTPVLTIDYTPPASDGKQTVINVQENQNFNRATDSTGAFSMAPYGFNVWFGGFTQPTYSIITTMPNSWPAPPGGGKILEITPQNGRPMIHNGAPTLEEGEWYNFSAYVYIPSTAPAAMDVNVVVLGHKSMPDSGIPHGQWARVDVSFIAGMSSMWCTVQANGSGFTWDSACKFYVANVQLTKGRKIRPYIYGERTMTNADHGWCGLNTGGYVRAEPPSVSLLPVGDKSRRGNWPLNWTYSSTAGHAQINSTVKTRKVKL